MAWRVAKSITTLHNQLKPHAPGAPATSWGTIGDALHSPNSDHAPKDFPGWGEDIVTAGDFPDGYGLNAWNVCESIRKSRDPRVKYVISEGRMYSSYVSSTGIPAWTWRPYAGSDGHFTHAHVSTVGDARADGTQPWATGLESTNMAQTDTYVEALYGDAFNGDGAGTIPGKAIVPAQYRGSKDTKGNADVSHRVFLVEMTKSIVGSLSTMTTLLTSLGTKVDQVLSKCDEIIAGITAIGNAPPVALDEDDIEQIAQQVVQKLGDLRFVPTAPEEPEPVQPPTQ